MGWVGATLLATLVLGAGGAVTSVCRIAVPPSGVRYSETWIQRSPTSRTLKIALVSRWRWRRESTQSRGVSPFGSDREGDAATLAT